MKWNSKKTSYEHPHDIVLYQHGCDLAVGNHSHADIEQYNTGTSVQANVINSKMLLQNY